MLPDKSRAQTMSMPLALTSVVLFISRGCASARMNIASTSQRNAARKFQRANGVRLSILRTSFTDEYKNAGCEPRRPLSHAASGNSRSSSKRYGCANVI